MKNQILLSLVLCGCLLGASELEFENLDISANSVSDEQKPFVSTGAVSSRSFEPNQTQSIDSVVRGIPGTFTQIDHSNGGVSVNVRGMTGLGRVDTKIDGVTQTFFGTSADSKFHTGTNGSTSAFSAMVDKNFLVGVDVARGSSSVGSNALMGSANFRTIGVDDLMGGGGSNKKFGLLGRYSYGTNGIGPSFMGAFATKFLQDDFSLGFLLAYSGSKKRQNYKTGNGNKIGDSLGTDEYGEEIVSPIAPEMLTQRPRSVLFKTEFTSENHKDTVQIRTYKNSLAGRSMSFSTFQNEYNYNPDSDLIDIKILTALNRATQLYGDGSFASQNLSDLAGEGSLQQENRSFTLDISNTSKFDIGDNINLETTLGASYLDNKYTSNVKKIDFTEGSTAFSPKGEQILKSLYLDNSLNYGIFTLDLGLNYTMWNLKGHKPECDDNPNCFPKYAIDIDKKGKYLNGATTLSAKIHDLFEPFIGYSISNRTPSVQEMFLASDHGNSVNPFLRPERAKTFEFGFNAFKDGLIVDGDIFGFKLTKYQTTIDDFIYNRRFDIGASFYLHINSLNPVKIKGYEAELMYDATKFYLKASYSRQDTASIISETSSDYFGSFGLSQISELPKFYANVELGTRLLDKKLNIGTIAKITGKAKRVYPGTDEREGGDPSDFSKPFAKQELPKIPTIFDLYAGYKFNKNFSIKAEVQNLFNKNYIDALNANNSSAQVSYDADGNNVYIFTNAARGRTYYVSFELKY